MPGSTNMESIKVVIVDDHATFRSGIRAVLSSKMNINVLGEYGNGRELLDALPNFVADVILLDIRMPVMDGVATLPLVRERYPHIKVIILSMHNEHSMIGHLMELGATAYLPKTAEGDIIYETILSCFTQETPASFN